MKNLYKEYTKLNITERGEKLVKLKDWLKYDNVKKHDKYLEVLFRIYLLNNINKNIYHDNPEESPKVAYQNELQIFNRLELKALEIREVKRFDDLSDHDKLVLEAMESRVSKLKKVYDIFLEKKEK
ncbi:MAG: hypothetical protein ACTSW1_08330 [Candidatus Hodarchaeales archaeon]